MMRRAENTKEMRNELNGYNILVDRADCHKIIAFMFTQEMTGTEKQVAYAKDILVQKVFKTDEMAGIMMSRGKMDAHSYTAGIESLIGQLDKMTDAKYIIQHVK